MRYAPLCYLAVVRVLVNADVFKAFQHGGYAGTTAAREWVKDNASRRRDQAAQVAHQG
jgi:hypothetical protein